MRDEELLKRLSINPKVMLEYDGLTPDDIAACLLFAKQALSDTDYLPLAEAS
jgi:hypothetical protein